MVLAAVTTLRKDPLVFCLEVPLILVARDLDGKNQEEKLLGQARF